MEISSAGFIVLSLCAAALTVFSLRIYVAHKKRRNIFVLLENV